MSHAEYLVEPCTIRNHVHVAGVGGGCDYGSGDAVENSSTSLSICLPANTRCILKVGLCIKYLTSFQQRKTVYFKFVLSTCI